MGRGGAHAGRRSGDGVFQLEGWAAGVEAGVGHAGGGFSGWPRGELDDVGVAQRPCERCFQGLMVDEPGGGEMNGAEQVGVEEYGLRLGQSRGQCVEGRGEVTQLFGGELGVVFELIDDGAEKGFPVNNVGVLLVPARLTGVVVSRIISPGISRFML